jgi:hypothetical protein
MIQKEEIVKSIYKKILYILIKIIKSFILTPEI